MSTELHQALEGFWSDSLSPFRIFEAVQADQVFQERFCFGDHEFTWNRGSPCVSL